ncbi:hypothetical protein [Paenibacillus sp. MMS18-CY102]|uniref:hypothetical protein n=1 Tax=Paenibacillus sp. MMS18-CY102 TaxID=2682849 RepID=UPI0013664525|nr:hypothetical protein [Paenibacillus sp. MMS18-CY102]MWC30883.1 hypothetical protein [Paenibacillus sp. MMS18-CY102]
MSGFSNWVTTNQEGEERGPIFVPDGHVISGVEVKEQAGFGITDIRLHFRKHNDDTGGVTQVTGWLTNGNHHWIKDEYLPNDKLVIGIQGKEQAGFGLVDVRMIYKNDNGSATSALFSEWVTKNPVDGHVTDALVPDGTYTFGIEGREQAGFGIVNLRLVY